MKPNLSLYSIFLATAIFSVKVSAFSLIPERQLLSGEIQVVKAKLLLNNRPFECLVDTGARITMVNANFIKDLPVVGTTVGGGISNPNQINELVSADIKIPETDSSSWFLKDAVIARTPRLPYECLIGNDFFINRVFTVDISSLKIEEAEWDENKASLPLYVYKNTSGGHFGFPLNVSGENIETLFDTGASATVIDLVVIKNHPEQFKFIKGATATDGNNQSIPVGFYIAKELKITNTVFKNVDVYGLDLTPLREKIPNVYGIIGMNIIKEHKWIFDLPHSRFSF